MTQQHSDPTGLHLRSAGPAAPPAGASSLSVHRLRRTYGEVVAVDGISLSLAPGSFTAVMGPSGSGKTTFLNCAAGLEDVSSGRVLIAGQDLTEWDEDRRTRFRRDHVGFVFQSFQLVPYLTVAQNVELPARLAGRRAQRRWVTELLDRVGLAGRADQLPTTLSGGQQQRVALARALVTRPAVLLADEPTGALDTTTAREVLQLLRDSVDGLGQTVLMVTHDPVAASYSDAVVFLVDGRLVGRMANPSVDAVAGQLAHLDDLVLAGAAS